MKLENHFTVDAPIDEAWQVLLDVQRVARCMPGATLDGVDGEDFNGKVKVKVGPIVVTYQGVARFVERDEHAHRAVIDASGKESRGSGTAKATVTTSLAEDGTRTRVSVLTDLNITGRPAQFGRGVIADVATALTGKFAESLAAELVSGHDEVGSDAGTAEDGATATTATAGAEGTDKTPEGEGMTAPGSASDGIEPARQARTEGGPVTAASDAGPAREDDDVIDLLGISATPLLKRFVPVLAVLGALSAVVLVRRRRRRRS